MKIEKLFLPECVHCYDRKMSIKEDIWWTTQMEYTTRDRAPKDIRDWYDSFDGAYRIVHMWENGDKAFPLCKICVIDIEDITDDDWEYTIIPARRMYHGPKKVGRKEKEKVGKA